MNKITKLLNLLVNIIFYPMLTLIFVLLILFACGIKPYITMSGSMEPAIQTGSVCFVNIKADYDDMKTGDVIAYRTSAGGLVTHRVISVREEGLETKGDNNDVSDGVSTTALNFHGETLFSVPYVGYVLKALQKPVNFAMIIIVVIGIFLFNAIDSRCENKEESEQLRENQETKANTNGGKYLEH